VRGATHSGFVIGPNVKGDSIMLAASLTTLPGDYTVDLSASTLTGEERATAISVRLLAVQAVPLATTQPPVLLLNGWQLGITNDYCPISTVSGTFGSLPTSLLRAGVPAVYFFDNCVEARNGLIESLGGVLKQFLSQIQSPQVDLVGHSMGGLIIRAYLAGLQPNGTFSPPASPPVRKVVEIATPNFGAFLAASNASVIPPDKYAQTSEMFPGSAFLWNLARWNQNSDDLRGVDAIAIIGSGGTYYSATHASDGLVTLTSASLGFTRDPSRTLILPYCHTDSGLLANSFLGTLDCSGVSIANVDEAPETGEIIQYFLSNDSRWQSVPNTHTPLSDAWLSKVGGIFFAETTASGSYIALSPTQTQWATVSLVAGVASPDVFVTDFVYGAGNFTSSTTGAISCGPFIEPAGYYSVVRCKPGPQISAVRPLNTLLPGMVVASGGPITISGLGFGTPCSTCQVLAYPGPVPLAVSSWTDSSISAVLPSSFNGFAQIVVQASSGQDYINVMTSPGSTTSPITFQTNPAGLQFSVDGSALVTAPQTLNLTGGAHTISVGTPQAGTAGTQYVFSSWSDGGAASHSITVSAAASYTATFQTQYKLTVSATPAAGGTVIPASGSFYNSGAVVPITAIPSSGYTFYGWTGNVSNSSAASTTVTMGSPQTVTANFASSAPTINPGGIVPLYSSVPLVQPGSWISIYGSNLANTTAVWNGNFPTSLGGVSVTIDNKPGYLWLVSPGQINLQAPDDTATGPVRVAVTTPNGTVSSTVTLTGVGPSFSLLSAKYAAGVILTSNGSGAYGGGTYDLLGPSGAFSFSTRPVKAGETIELYGVGFGPTNPHVAAGGAFSGAAPTANTVTVTIGGVQATVLFSGITSAGLYQFNVVVPSGAGSGDQLLQATVNGVQTPGGVYVTLQ
jgi:uncharacterized protein (TIGR03437 family)